MAAASLTPLDGGRSGRTFLSDVAGERTVVRIYPPGDPRGPDAPQVDETVVRLVRGLVPVAEVLEVRREDARSGQPGLLVTAWVPGERADRVVGGLDETGLARLGAAMGAVAATLAGMPMVRPGPYVDPDLRIGSFPERGLPEWVEGRLEGWSDSDRALLLPVAEAAQDLLDGVGRTCLVHGDLNPENVLVDPDTLEPTAVLDWELAHAGHPWTDVGNLVRFERQSAYVDAVLHAWTGRHGGTTAALLDGARSADLWALVELASRAGSDPVADRADVLLRTIATEGDVHAWPAGWESGWEGADPSVR